MGLPAGPELTEAGQPDRWLLVGLLAAASLLTLDFFAALAALPLLAADLHASSGQMQLVLAVPPVVGASLLIATGRLGDAWGRRRLLMAGATLHLVTTFGAAMAPDIGVLLAWRLMQGLATALLAPQVLALMSLGFAPVHRQRVFGWYASTLAAVGVAVQLVAGPLLLGLPEGLGWRVCLLVPMPGAALTLVALGRARAGRDQGPVTPSGVRRRPDLVGAVLVAGALGGGCLFLTVGREQGWPAWSWGMLALALACLLGLLAWQRRGAGRSPRLIPPGLIGRNRFTGAVLGLLCLYAGASALYYVLALSLRRLAGFSPGEVAAAFAWMGLALALVATSPAVRHWAGKRWLGRGVLVLALGHGAWVGALWVGGGAHAALGMTAASALLGAGLGLLMGPLMSHALAQVPAAYAASGGGVAASLQQVGNALGLSLVGVVALSGQAGAIDLPAMLAFEWATLALVWVLVRGRRPRRQGLRVPG